MIEISRSEGNVVSQRNDDALSTWVVRTPVNLHLPCFFSCCSKANINIFTHDSAYFAQGEMIHHAIIYAPESRLR